MMNIDGIKCGACKGRHATVGDVARCYTAYRGTPAGSSSAQAAMRSHRDGARDNVRSRDPYAAPVSEALNAQQTHLPYMDQPATPNRVNYIRDLREMKGLEPLAFAGTNAQASREIDRLKALPDARKPHVTNDHPAVEDGRYAILEPDETGKMVYKFYKVKNGYKRVFVEVYASDNRYAVNSRSRRAEILTAIAKDPKEAMLAFGREIGSCGHCGRTLTNDESRTAGIGPICASKLGW